MSSVNYMESQLQEFTTITSSSDRSKTIGFSSNKGGYIVAVVPRLWFPKEMTSGCVDDSKILIVPDKGSRKFHTTEIPKGVFLDGGGKSWVTITDGKNATQYSTESTNSDIEKESKLIHALFNLIRHNPKYDKKDDPLFKLSTDSTDFTTFLFKAIIDTVNVEMRELRRTYHEINVHSTTIRGRIDFSASIPLMACGSPELVCITEEFSLRAPHYSALMTAFDYISSVPSSENRNSLLSPVLKEITEETTVTRAKFREIPSMSHGMAVRTLRTTPLPPPLRKWSAIFGFALMVLEGGGAKIEAGEIVNNTVTWNGAKLWENILERITDIVYPKHSIPKEDIKMYNPWVKFKSKQKEILDTVKRKQPDIVISKDDVDIVIDAKYYDDLNSVMGGASNYQMLGYALSALDGEGGSPRVGKRTVAFAVPTRKNENEKEVHPNPNFKYKMQLPFTILAKDDTVKPPILQGLEVEFPAADVYVDEGEWDDYYNRVSKSLKKVVNVLLKDLGVGTQEEE